MNGAELHFDLAVLRRYSYPEALVHWSEEAKLRRWLEVELAILDAKATLGLISAASASAIRQHASFDLGRIQTLEALYDHDMIAFIASVREKLTEAGIGHLGGLFHNDVTSYDIEDPATVLALRAALHTVITALKELQHALEKRALEHRWTLCVADTHGQVAEPSTFGHLLLTFRAEIGRSVDRLERDIDDELSEAKLGGMVGNYASISPELAKVALSNLKLKLARWETQIMQRDRFARVVSDLALAAEAIERICLTFSRRMSYGVAELQEPFRTGQRGSSRGPHKRNPILTERLRGMARLLRADAQAMHESVATVGFREIEQSNVERHVLPHTTITVHYMAKKAASLISRLVVRPEKMRQHLDNALGTWASPRVRSALVAKGVDDDAAYTYLQQASFQAMEEQLPFNQTLSLLRIEGDGRTATNIIGEEALVKLFDPIEYIRPGIEFMFEQLVQGQ